VNGETLAILSYVVLQLAIGYYASKGIRTERDYLLAGRSLGYGLSMFTIFGTWFGAETCIGAAGEAYSTGLSGTRADPFGYTTCLLLMGLVFAVPLWKLKLTTLADLFRLRYGLIAERVAVLLMVPTSVIWAAAQVRAFGSVLSATSDLSISIATGIAAFVVIAYTTAGGMLADAWTDFIQGIVLIAGLLLLGAMMLTSGDGGQLAAVPPGHLSFTAPGESWLDSAEHWAVPILGSGVAHELVSRVIAARSAEVARRSSLIAAALYLSVGAIPLLLGMAGVHRFPGLADPEQILALQADHYLPSVLHVVFVGALVSAILSTVDSTLLVAGSLVAHNVVLPLNPGMSEARKLLANRIAVMCFGVIAYLLALSAEGVYALVEEASAFGTAGIFVSVVFGLFTPRFGGARSALVSLALGIIVYNGAAHLLALDHPYLLSVAAALMGYLAVAVFEPAPSPMVPATD
jgi:Na+/proline symporter